MTLTCAIVDDEPLAVKLLETYVQKTPLLQHCGSYSSAVEAMSGLREHPVNILFLDIQMPELNGLEFAQMLDAETRIVFTTAFSQYAIDGYKVNAIDYLLKPISYTDFLAATHKAAEWFSRGTGIAVPQPKEDTIPAATTDAFSSKAITKSFAYVLMTSSMWKDSRIMSKYILKAHEKPYCRSRRCVR